MSVYAGVNPAGAWATNTAVGRTHIATKSVVQSGLVLNLDAGVSASYPGTGTTWTDLSPAAVGPTIVLAKIYSTYNGLRSANYSVQYSDDTITWTTAFSGVMSTNSSFGIQSGTITSSIVYTAHRYWRYVEGTAIANHHPRTSRIILTDASGIDYNIIVYTTDNTNDQGGYQIGTITYDFNVIVKNNGTLVNGPTYSAANGGSIVFNGSNNYVDCGNTASLKITGSITAEAWVNFSSLTGSGDPRLIGKYSWSAGAAGTAWELNRSTSDYRSYGPGGSDGPNVNEFLWIASSGTGIGGAFIGTGEQVLSNTWYQVVGVFNNVNDVIQLYVNGVLKRSVVRTSQTVGILAAGTQNVQIGGNTGDGQNYINGVIPIARVYNRALSSAEVTQNFNATRSRYGI